METFWMRWLLSIIVLAWTASGTSARKPGKNPQSPPPPPIKYELRVFDMPTSQIGYVAVSVCAMSECGRIVGSYQGPDNLYRPFLYLYSLESDTIVDRNEYLQLYQQEFGIAVIPEGWSIMTARGINNHGYFSGTFKNDSASETVGYLLELDSAPRQLSVIPVPPGIELAFPTQINDHPDNLGTMRWSDGNEIYHAYNPFTNDLVQPLGLESVGRAMRIINPPFGHPSFIAALRPSDRPVIRHSVETGESPGLVVKSTT